MLIDSHVHVGQFFNNYYSPSDISQLMNDVGVDYYAVSSTTMCEENYIKVLDELHELIALDGERALSVMWITPEGLKGNIAWFLESDIKWRCLKVHPELHPNDWNPCGEQFKEVIDIAIELKLPILIHTGNKDCSKCSRYERVIANNPDVPFILAHGRPLADAKHIVSSYNNVYVDTAFMPVEDIVELVNSRMASNVLWGTDMCIPSHFYPQGDMRLYYNEKLSKLRNCCTNEQFTLVTYENSRRLFSIK